MYSRTTVKLVENHAFAWFRHQQVQAKGIVFNSQNQLLSGIDLCKYFSDCQTLSEFEAKLNDANGSFSVVIERPNATWAAVDRLRNFPLFTESNAKNLIISDSINVFKTNPQKTIDPLSANLFRLSGWVPGNRTLLSGVEQLSAGELICMDENGLIRKRYAGFVPKTAPNFTPTFEQFQTILQGVSLKLMKVVAEKPVILPLTAGFDSRLIAVLLKQMGHQKVTCVTYGRKNNCEVETAKQVADRLGFDWIFIDYAQTPYRDILTSESFNAYLRYSGNGTSMPFLQELPAIEYLRQHHIIDPDSVVLPGHSADALAGSHLQPSFASSGSLLHYQNAIVSKYFTHDTLPSRHQLKETQQEIAKELQKSPFAEPFVLFDDWNFKERQAKFIVNSSKAWDFYGIPYYLPLWDNQLTAFFIHQPLFNRLYKHFYKQACLQLFEQHGLVFDNDLIDNRKLVKKQEQKNTFKRLFPEILHLKKLGYADTLMYREMTEVLDPKHEFVKGALTYNGVLIQWYLNHFANR